MLLLLITFFSFAQEKIWSFFKLFLTPHFNFGNRYKIFSSGKCTIVEISVIFNIFVEDKYSCLLNQHRSSFYLANAGCQPPSAIMLPVREWGEMMLLIERNSAGIPCILMLAIHPHARIMCEQWAAHTADRKTLPWNSVLVSLSNSTTLTSNTQCKWKQHNFTRVNFMTIP